eukprot:NODE_270_length_3252_cov_5.903680.p1 GENE.NODE_270_length_3252_cov_5.903680~~NODE_270_length_3252_cov_5.903680.p1  ORF type:complete len:1014 (+),score=280.35 NODE_270_length_3252_cov_5.903680:377-3043(+)
MASRLHALFQPISHEAHLRLADIKPRELANLLYGLGRMRAFNLFFWQAALLQAGEQLIMCAAAAADSSTSSSPNNWNSHEIVALLSAAEMFQHHRRMTGVPAPVDVAHPEVIAISTVLGGASARLRVDELSPQEVADAVHALVVLSDSGCVTWDLWRNVRMGLCRSILVTATPSWLRCLAHSVPQPLQGYAPKSMSRAGPGTASKMLWGLTHLGVDIAATQPWLLRWASTSLVTGVLREVAQPSSAGLQQASELLGAIATAAHGVTLVKGGGGTPPSRFSLQSQHLHAEFVAAVLWLGPMISTGILAHDQAPVIRCLVAYAMLAHLDDGAAFRSSLAVKAVFDHVLGTGNGEQAAEEEEGAPATLGYRLAHSPTLLADAAWACGRLGLRQPSLAQLGLAACANHVDWWVLLWRGNMLRLGKLLWGLLAVSSAMPDAISVLGMTAEHAGPTLHMAQRSLIPPADILVLIWMFAALGVLANAAIATVLKPSLEAWEDSGICTGTWELELAWELMVLVSKELGIMETTSTAYAEWDSWRSAAGEAWVRERGLASAALHSEARVELAHALTLLGLTFELDAEAAAEESQRGLVVDAVLSIDGECRWCIEIISDAEMPPPMRGGAHRGGDPRVCSYGRAQVKRLHLWQSGWHVIDIWMSTLQKGEAEIAAAVGRILESAGCTWPDGAGEAYDAIRSAALSPDMCVDEEDEEGCADVPARVSTTQRLRRWRVAGPMQPATSWLDELEHDALRCAEDAAMQRIFGGGTRAAAPGKGSAPDSATPPATLPPPPPPPPLRKSGEQLTLPPASFSVPPAVAAPPAMRASSAQKTPVAQPNFSVPLSGVVARPATQASSAHKTSSPRKRKLELMVDIRPRSVVSKKKLAAGTHLSPSAN